MKEEIDKVSTTQASVQQQQQQQQQTHISRNFNRSIRYPDCDTSIIDMDISPERKTTTTTTIIPMIKTRKLRATIKNAIKLKKSLIKFKSTSNNTNNKTSKTFIFVGNISKNYTKHDIKQIFSRFGEIVSVNLYGKRYR